MAIPQLRLAIEWNGIVHFKPIYGQETLETLRERDDRKLRMAKMSDVNLIVIADLDSRAKTLDRAFDEVRSIINSLIQSDADDRPSAP